MCVATESVVGDDGEQSVFRPSVHGRPTGCTDETTHAAAVAFLLLLPSSGGDGSSCGSRVISVVDGGWSASDRHVYVCT